VTALSLAAPIVLALVAAVSAFVAVLRWSLEPRIKLAIVETMKPQSEKVDRIEASLSNIEATVGRQSEDNHRIEGKVDDLSDKLGDIAERTAALEGAARTKSGTRRKRSA
jgi:hypothetical protein